MPRYKLVNGEQIQLTAQEEAQRDAEEKAWNDGAFDRAMADLRQKRNSLLSATDYFALQDVTLSKEMMKYRKDLRNITEGLKTIKQINLVKFPKKPLK
jgi:endonuclease/exonuclease/phosphatase family metal-dependent hydrolase